MSGERLILDHVENIVVSRDAHHNNLNVLRSLDIGMFHLATFARQREVAALEIHGAGKVVHLFQITNDQWRNKIAAHRAAVDPQDDNLTTLTFSTMPAVTYQSPLYGVGYLKLFMGRGGELDIEAWALTQKYEALAPRCWPERRLPKLDW